MYCILRGPSVADAPIDSSAHATVHCTMYSHWQTQSHTGTHTHMQVLFNTRTHYITHTYIGDRLFRIQHCTVCYVVGTHQRSCQKWLNFSCRVPRFPLFSDYARAADFLVIQNIKYPWNRNLYFIPAPRIISHRYRIWMHPPTTKSPTVILGNHYPIKNIILQENQSSCLHLLTKKQMGLPIFLRIGKGAVE